MTKKNCSIEESKNVRVIIVAGPEDADEQGKTFSVPDLMGLPHLSHDLPRSQQTWGVFPEIIRSCVAIERQKPNQEKYVLLGILFQRERIVCIVGPKEIHFSVPELSDFPKYFHNTKGDDYSFLGTIESFIAEIRKEKGKEEYVPVAILFDRSFTNQETSDKNLDNFL